jgi:hypothetical protein
LPSTNTLKVRTTPNTRNHVTTPALYVSAPIAVAVAAVALAPFACASAPLDRTAQGAVEKISAMHRPVREHGGTKGR